MCWGKEFLGRIWVYHGNWNGLLNEIVKQENYYCLPKLKGNKVIELHIIVRLSN